MTELTTAEETRIAAHQDLMDDTPVDAKDLVIPKLLLMQSMSKQVQDENAKPGDIIESLGGSVVNLRDEKLEIIPFKCVKTWVRIRDKGGKQEYLGQTPYTLENADWPREEFVEGHKVVNFETINYYCLIPSEIERGDFLPYVVSFRSTSYKTGRALETYRAKLANFKKPICFKTFHLGARAEENDKGRYYVFTIEQGRDTTDEELSEVKPWLERVQQNSVKVDESDLEGSRNNEDEADEATGATREF